MDVEGSVVIVNDEVGELAWREVDGRIAGVQTGSASVDGHGGGKQWMRGLSPVGRTKTPERNVEGSTTE